MIASVTRTRTVLTALTCTSVLALGACSGDDPEPKFAPTPTPTAPTSPSPTDEAMSPEDTVRAWVDAQNHALRTGDTGAMKSLSADGCRGCDDFTNPIEQVYRDGGHFSTDGWTVEGTHLKSTADPSVVDLAVTIAGGRTTAKAGAQPVTYESEKELLVVKLVPDGDSWAISFIGFIT